MIFANYSNDYSAYAHSTLCNAYILHILCRRNTIMFSQVFTIIGAVTSTLTVVANAPSVFVIGRFFLGINAGIGNCMASVFLSEIAPFNLRGKCGISHSVAGGVGNVVAAVLGLGSVMGTYTCRPTGCRLVIFLSLQK